MATLGWSQHHCSTGPPTLLPFSQGAPNQMGGPRLTTCGKGTLCKCCKDVGIQQASLQPIPEVVEI
jgi:hypothetical protein